MNKVFNPSNKHRLDNPERRKNMPPEKILGIIELKKGDVFLDVGAGTGYFSIPALDTVGENGRVIAADISDEMLTEIEKKTGDPHNLLLMETTPNEILLPSKSVDKILMSMVLHEINDQIMYLKNLNDILRDNGTITIVEWKKEETGKGPSIKHRISKEELDELAIKAGFSRINNHEFDALYVAVYKK
ncbi:MAG: methyltransferase [Candidatus Muiribacterium halophilum]|uniref:Methyltransferase n=1 Tax=Muiribacterium halophilum TaxID=2053465 RepID=A0A2N5ZI62_MUIH1|nr:MAG: methyltransferase [Candidatus Muirbacterium halophilum]